MINHYLTTQEFEHTTADVCGRCGEPWPCEGERLRANLEHWHDKEASRGHKCWLNEERVTALEKGINVARRLINSAPRLVSCETLLAMIETELQNALGEGTTRGEVSG